MVITEDLVNQSDKNTSALISPLGMKNKQMERLPGKWYHERRVMENSRGERPLQIRPVRHLDKD